MGIYQMKIFNKILKKNIDYTNISFETTKQINKLQFYKVDLISKSFARNFNNNSEITSSFEKNINDAVKQPEKKFNETPKIEIKGKSEYQGNKPRDFQREDKEKKFEKKRNYEDRGE